MALHVSDVYLCSWFPSHPLWSRWSSFSILARLTCFTFDPRLTIRTLGKKQEMSLCFIKPIIFLYIFALLQRYLVATYRRSLEADSTSWTRFTSRALLISSHTQIHPSSRRNGRHSKCSPQFNVSCEIKCSTDRNSSCASASCRSWWAGFSLKSKKFKDLQTRKGFSYIYVSIMVQSKTGPTNKIWRM